MSLDYPLCQGCPNGPGCLEDCSLNTGARRIHFERRKKHQHLAAIIAGGMIGPYQPRRLIDEDEIAEDALAVALKIIEKTED